MKTILALAFVCVAAFSMADGCCAGKKLTAEQQFQHDAHVMMMKSEGKVTCCKSTEAKPVVKGAAGCCKAPKAAKAVKTAKKACCAAKAAKK